MDPTFPDPRTPARIGRYVDLHLLGRGGMGAVYRGFDPELDRPVAIKVMLHSSDDFVARFRREAQAVARLTHGNVVQVYDFGVDEDNNPYFVMELVEGTPLDQVLREQGRLPEARAIDIARQAALGLAAAHRAGLIHRDVKPSNLIVDGRGGVKLVDFGIARSSSGAQLTQAASLMGTPGYMSPEQAQGKTVDARADIYALGLTLFEMLAGEAPFFAEDPIALVVMNMQEPLPDLRQRGLGLSPAVVQLVEQMSEKDPAQRPQTSDAVARALEAMGAEMPAQAMTDAGMAAGAAPSVPPTHVYAVPPTQVNGSRRGLALAVGAALAVGGIGVALLLLLRPTHSSAHLGTATIDTPSRPPRAAKVEPSAALPVEPHAARPAAATGPLRVAVLKFQNLAHDPAFEGLALGIGETAVSAMAGTAHGRLELVERGDIESDIGEIDRGKDEHFDKASVAQAGKLAGVEIAVQGAFQKVGGFIRVTARFVRVQTGEILDTVRVDGKARKVLDLQDLVALSLKDHLVALVERERPASKGAQ